MDTVYVKGPLPHTTETRERQAEIQVEPTEDAGGKLLDLRVHDYDDGEQLGSTELTRAAVVQLRDALDGWLATQPEE